MRKTKKSKDKVAIAITLCFCALAIVSIFTMRSSLDQLDQRPDNSINIANEERSGEQDVVNPVPVVDSTEKESEKKEIEKTKNESADIANEPIFILPINGAITVNYSTDFPVYSKTLEQYIIHEGIDYEAPEGTEVMAISDGTVTAVYTDDKLGMTIEILHGNGITSKYCNLSSTDMIQTGDVVKGGTVISQVGTSALFESLDPPHLHFEVLKDGQKINPEQFINGQ